MSDVIIHDDMATEAWRGTREEFEKMASGGGLAHLKAHHIDPYGARKSNPMLQQYSDELKCIARGISPAVK